MVSTPVFLSQTLLCFHEHITSLTRPTGTASSAHVNKGDKYLDTQRFSGLAIKEHRYLVFSSVPKGQGGCTSLHKSDFLHADSLGNDNSEFDH